jgi:tetratricopeptide (TPR) repeat protein
MRAAYEADPSMERRFSQALELFMRSSDEKQLDAWVAHSPDAYQPYLARAEFHVEESSRKRGEDWASKTTDAQFRGMRTELSKCANDVDQALSIERNLADAYVMRIRIANAQGHDQDKRDAFDEGIALFPHSYAIYATMMHALLPRWGGTYAQMDAVAKKAIAASPNDPDMYALYCQLYSDQADVLERNKDHKAAIAAWTKALQYGADPESHLRRGWTYYEVGDDTRALADADRHLALQPDSSDGHLLRAYALVGMGRAKEAGVEIRTVERISPEDKKAITDWREYAAYRLTHKGK